ncbi:hypothetical protein BJV77DRAFT_960725 [Russula vinacea]|nr:hypothetical protein BJV77DRAFT_960725 [Russula vinacea]
MPSMVHRRVVPPRSPLPARAKQVVNPGAPDMAKPKRTSSERQANELEQLRISTLAKMELQDELQEEEAEHAVVKKLARTDGLDDIEDVVMQSEDISVSSGEDDKAVEAESVAPEQTQVAKLPTGLVPNWQLKVQLKQSLKVKANAAETSTLGGLEDDDTSAEILFVRIDDGGTTIGQPCQALAPVKPLKGAHNPTVKPKEPTRKVSKKMGQPALKPNSKGLAVTLTSDLSRLPEFAHAARSTKFLPTLYDCLGCSPNPFVINPDIVEAIQEVVDFAYQSRNNAYANNPKAIADYAQWAIRGNGPALFGKPTPMDCKVSKGADGYIKPEGIFEANFIIQLVSQYLKWCTGCATTMAGLLVPCRWQLQLLNTLSLFVGDFLYIATQLSDRQWGLIMTHCGDNKGSPVPMTQSVPVNRRAMYEQSSPTKESELEADDEWET